jgi:hypothetical protein
VKLKKDHRALVIEKYPRDIRFRKLGKTSGFSGSVKVQNFGRK